MFFVTFPDNSNGPGAAPANLNPVAPNADWNYNSIPPVTIAEQLNAPAGFHPAGWSQGAVAEQGAVVESTWRGSRDEPWIAIVPKGPENTEVTGLMFQIPSSLPTASDLNRNLEVKSFKTYISFVAFSRQVFRSLNGRPWMISVGARSIGQNTAHLMVWANGPGGEIVRPTDFPVRGGLQICSEAGMMISKGAVTGSWEVCTGQPVQQANVNIIGELPPSNSVQ